MKYRFVGNGRRWIRKVGAVVESGDVFESGDVVFNDANFEEVKEKEKPALPAKEVQP